MSDHLRRRKRLGFAGFLVGVVVSFGIGLVVFGDPLREVVPSAIASGIGLGIGFYLFVRTGVESAAAE